MEWVCFITVNSVARRLDLAIQPEQSVTFAQMRKNILSVMGDRALCASVRRPCTCRPGQVPLANDDRFKMRIADEREDLSNEDDRVRKKVCK